MIDLLVIAPSEEITQHTPIGFALLDQVFTEAGLKDKVSEPQSTAEALRRTLIYLTRRYPRRIRIQWIEPLSLRGLYLKFRFHLSTYPVILIHTEGETRLLSSNDAKHLADVVRDVLENPVKT